MIEQRKPRIAILHYAAPPTIGGVESTMLIHARLFADHDYAVKIVAGRGEIFDPRVPVHIIPTLDSRHAFVESVNRKLNLGLIPTDIYPLTQTIRKALQTVLADVDICIAHNLTTLHKNLALTVVLHELTQQEHLPLIAWCHDFAWQDPVYANDIHDGFPWNLLRQAWSGVKYVVVSEARRQELATMLKIAARDIVVVPPGLDAVDPNLFSQVPQYEMKQRVVKEYNWERIFTDRIEPLIDSLRVSDPKDKHYGDKYTTDSTSHH